MLPKMSYKYILSRSPKLDWVSLAYITPHITKKIRKVTQRTYYILDTLSTETTQTSIYARL